MKPNQRSWSQNWISNATLRQSLSQPIYTLRNIKDERTHGSALFVKALLDHCNGVFTKKSIWVLLLLLQSSWRPMKWITRPQCCRIYKWIDFTIILLIFKHFSSVTHLWCLPELVCFLSPESTQNAPKRLVSKHKLWKYSRTMSLRCIEPILHECSV